MIIIPPPLSRRLTRCVIVIPMPPTKHDHIHSAFLNPKFPFELPVVVPRSLFPTYPSPPSSAATATYSSSSSASSLSLSLSLSLGFAYQYSNEVKLMQAPSFRSSVVVVVVVVVHCVAEKCFLRM